MHTEIYEARKEVILEFMKDSRYHPMKLKEMSILQKQAALDVPVIHLPDGTQRKMAKALPMRLVILFPRPRILPFMRSGS